jgi:hypothetical protein
MRGLRSRRVHATEKSLFPVLQKHASSLLTLPLQQNIRMSYSSEVAMVFGRLAAISCICFS